MNYTPFSLFIAALLIPISTTGMAQQTFDGRWSIEAVPEKGACRRTHRYVVMIKDGAIRKSDRERANISGGLEASGRIRGSIQRNRTRVDVAGSLSARSGSGDWLTEGRVDCSGRWTADKVG